VARQKNLGHAAARESPLQSVRSEGNPVGHDEILARRNSDVGCRDCFIEAWYLAAMRVVLVVVLAGCTRPAPDYINCAPNDEVCLRQHDLGAPEQMRGTTNDGTTAGGTTAGGTTAGGTTAGGTTAGGTTAGGTTAGGTTAGGTTAGGTTAGGTTAGMSLGGACSGSCAAGEVCALAHGVRDVNICRQPCQIDGDCQQATFPGGLAPFCESGSCSISCNPVAAAEGVNGCGPGLTCYAISDRSRPSGEVVITDCVPTGNGTLGASCNATPDCAPGLVCLNFAVLTQCRQLCNLADGSGCPSTQTCGAFFNVTSLYGFCS
jgi:hypothetical protein